MGQNNEKKRTVKKNIDNLTIGCYIKYAAEARKKTIVSRWNKNTYS